MLKHMAVVFLMCMGSAVVWCSDQPTEFGPIDQVVLLGPIDQMGLKKCIDTFGWSNLKDDLEQQRMSTLWYKTSLARNDTSELGKAVFEKLHTIKNKSDYQSLNVDTYSEVQASDNHSGSVKDADPLTFRTIFTDMSVLRAALERLKHQYNS